MAVAIRYSLFIVVSRQKRHLNFPVTVFIDHNTHGSDRYLAHYNNGVIEIPPYILYRLHLHLLHLMGFHRFSLIQS